MALTQPPFPRSSPEWLAAIGPVLVAGGAGVVAILGFGFLVRADPQAISWMVLVAAGVTGLSAWHVVERVGFIACQVYTNYHEQKRVSETVAYVLQHGARNGVLLAA